MTIEHRLIAEGNLHEPKGISTAPVDTVYVANGVGGGVWRALNPSTSFGSMLVTEPGGSALTLNGASDVTLWTPSQFSVLTGPSAPFQAGPSGGVSFSTNRLTTSVSGVYQAHLDMSFYFAGAPGSFPVRFAVRFRKNGGIHSGLKSTILIMDSSNETSATHSLSLTELFSMNAGDYLQIVVAATSRNSIKFESISCFISLIS